MLHTLLITSTKGLISYSTIGFLEPCLLRGQNENDFFATSSQGVSSKRRSWRHKFGRWTGAGWNGWKWSAFGFMPTSSSFHPQLQNQFKDYYKLREITTRQ